MRPIDMKDRMTMYQFDHVRIFQSPITNEQFVTFYDPNQTRIARVPLGGISGLMVSAPATGPILIQTDGKDRPQEKKVLYTIRAQQPIPAATPTPAQ